MEKLTWNERLCRAMKEAGFTQGRLARTIGSQQSRVGHYCHGRREPDFATLCKIASILDISIDWLLFGTTRLQPNRSQQLSALHARLPPNAQAELERIARAFDLAYCQATPAKNLSRRAREETRAA